MNTLKNAFLHSLENKLENASVNILRSEFTLAKIMFF